MSELERILSRQRRRRRYINMMGFVLLLSSCEKRETNKYKLYKNKIIILVPGEPPSQTATTLKPRQRHRVCVHPREPTHIYLQKPVVAKSSRRRRVGIGDRCRRFSVFLQLSIRAVVKLCVSRIGN